MLDAADPRYVRTLLRHYGSVTPEYEMEMSQLEPARGRFDFARADRIVAFAARHGLPVRGHTLVWDEMIPAWVTGRSWTRAAADRGSCTATSRPSSRTTAAAWGSGTS